MNKSFLGDSTPAQSITSVIATVLCLPHFFEHESRRLPSGQIVSGEADINEEYYYKLLYYSIIDPALR